MSYPVAVYSWFHVIFRRTLNENVRQASSKSFARDVLESRAVIASLQSTHSTSQNSFIHSTCKCLISHVVGITYKSFLITAGGNDAQNMILSCEHHSCCSTQQHPRDRHNIINSICRFFTYVLARLRSQQRHRYNGEIQHCSTNHTVCPSNNNTGVCKLFSPWSAQNIPRPLAAVFNKKKQQNLLNS